MPLCKTLGCSTAVPLNQDFCTSCRPLSKPTAVGSLAAKYPQYYKPVGHFTEIDTYVVNHLFDIQDPSGCLQHASKKILLSGVRTGGKSAYEDIKEARDSLTRWLQINQSIQGNPNDPVC